MTEEEKEEAAAEQKEKDDILKSLKVGGGSVGAIGGGIWGITTGVRKLDDRLSDKKLADKKYLDTLLKKKALTRKLTDSELELLNSGSNIGKWLTGIGATSYLGTKAYEHYKNKKKKDDDNLQA